MTRKLNAAALAHVLAIVSVALCLVPVGAHFFELQNKMALLPGEYMTVQKIYAGWAWFGIAIMLALLATLWHTVLVRADRPAFVLSLAAFLGIAATLAIFFAFTYPVNVASQFWTVAPEPFEAARRQWEYSHATNAAVTFASLLAIVFSAILYRGREKG